jgi:RNA polymerase sigma factor (sigma-70 family)
MANGFEVDLRPTVLKPPAADFEAFLREQQAALTGFLRRRLPTEEDAQDVAQESVLRMLRYRDTEPPQAWKPLLYRVATNIACDHARRRAAHRAADHVPIEQQELICEAAQPQQAMEQDEVLGVLEHALLQLSPRCRQVFLLHRMEGQTYAQIARHFGVSESMIHKYISRALATLTRIGRAYQGSGERREGTP